MIYVYILTMAAVTYLIRMLPLTLLRRKIRSRFLRAFLFYVPYACLTAMTFPAILSSTDALASAIVGLLVAIAASWRGAGLLPVALWACGAVFVTERLLAVPAWLQSGGAEAFFQGQTTFTVIHAMLVVLAAAVVYLAVLVLQEKKQK